MPLPVPGSNQHWPRALGRGRRRHEIYSGQTRLPGHSISVSRGPPADRARSPGHGRPPPRGGGQAGPGVLRTPDSSRTGQGMLQLPLGSGSGDQGWVACRQPCRDSRRWRHRSGSRSRQRGQELADRGPATPVVKNAAEETTPGSSCCRFHQVDRDGSTRSPRSTALGNRSGRAIYEIRYSNSRKRKKIFAYM